MTDKVHKLLIYQGENGEILLNEDYDNQTIWASLDQIAIIFDRDKSTISRHIKNIFESGELSEFSTVAKNATVQKEGERLVERIIEYYNLDMIISVGYRVNSIIATKFRKWATNIIKDHITKGYSINQNQIKRNIDGFKETVNQLELLIKGKKIDNDEIFSLISLFTSTWFNLDNYDKSNFPLKGLTQTTFKLQSDKLNFDVITLKNVLIKKGEASNLFAMEKKQGALKGIFGNIYASFDDKELYPSVEEKAAHLLYFIVKNHPFNDGNKRIGAFAFIWFLQKYNFEFKQKITPQALTSLTLLIATSDPKEKDRLIGLILLLLK